MESVAPWFLKEGILNLPQWEHLGRAFRKAEEGAGPLPEGTLGIWNLVRSCLIETETFADYVKTGQDALKAVMGEASQKNADCDSDGDAGLSGEELDKVGSQLAAVGLTDAAKPCPEPPTLPEAPVPPPSLTRVGRPHRASQAGA